MALSSDLVSEFVKVTKTTEKPKNETTVYGTIVEYDGSSYVQLDGSELLTPVSATADTKPGERVTVMIKNHTATVTGNITSPAARTDDVQELGNSVSEIGDEISEFEVVIADKVSTQELEAERARIDVLVSDNVVIKEELTANKADISELEADNVTIKESLTAVEATIKDLNVDNLDAKYANIDFSNITKATMEYFYSESGLIENVVVGDGTIAGNLIGVTIKGDLIEGNTVVADKLVIKGEDGLYYKLNTDGVTTEAEQTDYNSLNGSIITAKSIAATKISVDDLVAFDATIGGFNITNESIYSGVKESVDNTTRGIYLDNDGQVAIGDSNNFIKYYKDDDGSYKLEISSVSDAAKTATNFLSYDSTGGLQVGDKTSGSWVGFRTQITATAFNILDAAGSVLASYGAKLIELGKNAADAVITLCGGKGQIEYITDADTGDEYLQIAADKLRLKSDSISSVYSTYTDDASRWEKSAVNVSPTKVYIYASECVDSSLSDMIEGWNISEILVNSGDIVVTTPGDMTINAASVHDSYGELLSMVEGGSGIWTYKKWSNGDVEMRGTYVVADMSCASTLGGMYRTDVFAPDAFPFPIYEPSLTASYESDGYGGILWATTATTENNPPSYYLIRPTSATIVNGKINFHVNGKWTT